MTTLITYKKNLFINCLKLIRFHKPVGTILLFLPTLSALLIANKGFPAKNIFLLFLFGTFVMRSAGCVLNDLADQKFDGLVARTKNRPLANGEMTQNNAFVILLMLLFIALFIVLKLPATCFYYSLMALAVTIIYPFCKRFFHAPQLILGVAFSFGIPMAFAASNLNFGANGWMLLLINYLWIVNYDTIYALADIKDDIKIGINSTAILFGKYVFSVITILNIIMHLLWLVLAIFNNFSYQFYVIWFFASAVLVYQQKIVKDEKPIVAFNISIIYGSLMLLGILF